MSRKKKVSPAIPRNRRTTGVGWTTVRKVRRALYTGTRLVRDIEVLASGDPAKIWRRLRNKLVGRALGRLTWRLWQ